MESIKASVPFSRWTLALFGIVTLGVARAEPPTPPSVEQRSCDLDATRGYCIGMSAVTRGADALVAGCAADGGRPLGVCRTDDTIALCSLPVTGPLEMHNYFFSGTGAHAWTVPRARVECTRLGGELQIPYR